MPAGQSFGRMLYLAVMPEKFRLYLKSKQQLFSLEEKKKSEGVEILC